MINSYNEWMEFYSCPRPMHTGWVFTHQDTFKDKGCRVSGYMDEGYFPIGFFQLWNPSKSNICIYPNEHGQADRTDMMFSKLWNKSKRYFIPEFTVTHLESEEVKMGLNWKGRKSKNFGPEVKKIPDIDFTIYKNKVSQNVKKEPLDPNLFDFGPAFY